MDAPYFFRSGALRIAVEIYGTNHERREIARGHVIVPSGFKWEFDDLGSGVGGYGFNGKHADDDLAHAMAADSILAFGSYYTTHNRGDDTPEWAPPPEIADEIDSEGELRSDDLEYGPLPDGGFAGDLFVVRPEPAP